MTQAEPNRARLGLARSVTVGLDEPSRAGLVPSDGLEARLETQNPSTIHFERSKPSLTSGSRAGTTMSGSKLATEISCMACDEEV
jgi:hypothetical protein